MSIGVSLFASSTVLSDLDVHPSLRPRFGSKFLGYDSMEVQYRLGTKSGVVFLNIYWGCVIDC